LQGFYNVQKGRWFNVADYNQFGSVKPGTPQVCAHCESLLMDVLDRTATPADQAFFDKHLASCTTCSRMFMDAKRGGAWLEMLRDPRPEPASSLFERIIAQTSGAQTAAAPSVAEVTPQAHETPGQFIPFPVTPVPVPSPYLYGTPQPTNFAGAKVLPFRLRNAVHSLGQTMLQPRLAMTAAMAFFSIALTLNLTGVHLSELRAEDLKPSNIRKGIYEAKAHVVRYSDNLRVVYELEARAHDLQRSSDSDSAPQQQTQPTDNKAPAKQDPAPADSPDGKPAPAKQRKAGPGTSRREPLFPDGRMVAVVSGESTEPKDLPTTVSLLHHQGVSQPAMQLKGDLA
jgi:hypothetical protein